MKLWTEHFTVLVCNPSVIEENVTSNLSQRDIVSDDGTSNYRGDQRGNRSIKYWQGEFFSMAIKTVNVGKVPCFDGIPVINRLNGCNRLAVEIHLIIIAGWVFLFLRVGYMPF